MDNRSSLHTGRASGTLYTIRRATRRAAQARSAEDPAQTELENHPPVALANDGAGRIPSASTVALPTVGDAAALEPNVVLPGNQSTEEAHSSTNKSTASGQN
jgi:hypothetical protein